MQGWSEQFYELRPRARAKPQNEGGLVGTVEAPVKSPEMAKGLRNWADE